jgi:hypothetical protein
MLNDIDTYDCSYFKASTTATREAGTSLEAKVLLAFKEFEKYPELS